MIKDIHNINLENKVFLNWVGIKNHPFRASIKMSDEIYPLTGRIQCGVSLGDSLKGIHMSRLSEEINNFFDKELNINSMSQMSNIILDRLSTKNVWINFKLQLFLKQKAPISKKEGYESVNIQVDHLNLSKKISNTISLFVTGTSLCPASKANSRFGAHSQRSKIKISFPFTDNLKEYLEIIYLNFSARTYPILKIQDEIQVTEQAYENPKFVEDLVRDLITSLHKKKLPFNCIKCENYESIHNYDVFAEHKI